MIRDPLKEIKKTSKLNAESLDGMSGEKNLKNSPIEELGTEISDNNNQVELECVTPKKKHKKAKRKQEALEEGSKPPKKLAPPNFPEKAELFFGLASICKHDV